MEGIRRRPRVVVPLVVSILATAALQAQTGQEIPEPGDGRWAAATVALLQHGHERCSGVSNRIMTYWKNLSGSEAKVRSSLDRYVLTRATGDLAGARKALDVARGFLPRAKAEIEAARSTVLDRFYDAETALCNVIAQPAPPFEVFEEQLLAAKSRVLEIEAELGSILTLPDRQLLVKELQPYTGLIENAVDVAKEKVRREFEENKAPPAPPTPQELMDAWHKDYVPAVAGAKAALGAYLRGREKSDSGAIQEACKDLLEAVIPLLTEGNTVFKAPDPDVEVPLSTVYKAMRRLGNRCTAGRFKEADEAYTWLRENLDKAARVLNVYSLRP